MDLSQEQHARGTRANLAVPANLVISDIARLFSRQRAPCGRCCWSAWKSHVPALPPIVDGVDEARQEHAISRPTFTTAECNRMTEALLSVLSDLLPSEPDFSCGGHPA